jgi:proteasome lid subunit RPN8/RPN11
MTIQLTPEQEQVIDQAIEAGVIKTAGDVVGMGVETIQRRLEQRSAPVEPRTAEQWVQEFHNWVHSHPTTTALLSEEAISRDSIYGTQGQ